ncbi:MAG: Stk1 family PASTA domain-containing Ser/Thr kinase [Acidimicrobiales bacterium]
MDSSGAPRVLSGRYELVHLVARGGMAEVYRAHDRLLDRPVAVKVLFPELSIDRTFVERFRREAQAAANLSHPNIVPVFDWGEDSGTYFIVMEFVDGRALSSILKTAGPLHPDRAAEITADVALALDYAHRHMVIHRDVKPGNVLITDEGQVKVTDFGIARAVNTDESLTQTGAVMGTATYFSPEQAEGLGVDARSDIYSLGVVLYEMVAGRPPFIGDSPVSVASKHVREQAPAPRQFNPSIPPDLEAIILKCMAKAPEYRYATGGDLRVDLLRFREGRAVGAGPVPTGETQAQLMPGHTQALPQVQPAFVEEEEPSRTGLYVAVLIVLLIALAVVVAFLGNTLGWWHLGSSSPTSFSLPSVTGQQVGPAESTLRAKGLDTTVKDEPSNASQRGVVLGTNPSSGTQVHKGQLITLDVGSGTPNVADVLVPPVIGFSLHDAEIAMFDSGLQVFSITGSCNQPNGVVCSENPTFGTQVKKGSSVTLLVSNVPTSTTSSSTTTKVTTYPVPTVQNDNVSTACAIIQSFNLSCAPESQFQRAPSTSVSQGNVITTIPAPGTAEPAGYAVKLVISTGPPVDVPPVVGELQQVAENQLVAANLVPVVTYDTSDHAVKDCGKVTNQNPAPNTPVSTGSNVDITIGDGPKCNISPTTTPTTAAIEFPSKNYGSFILVVYGREVI